MGSTEIVCGAETLTLMHVICDNDFVVTVHVFHIVPRTFRLN